MYDFIDEAVDKKINTLLEQEYSASVGIAQIKGQMNLNWTQCTNTRCIRLPDVFQKRICKFECQRTSYQDAMNRMIAERTNCNRMPNPRPCVNAFDNSIRGLRDKVNTIYKQIDSARRNAAQFRTRTARGAAAGPGA
jgi:hypothetical protein